MRKTLFFLFIFLFNIIYSHADNRNMAIGARTKAMGGVSVAMVDFWSSQNNPAALGFFEKTAIGFHYDNRYLLPATSTAAISATMFAEKMGMFAINTSFYGDKNFGKMQIGATYARAFAKVIGVSLQFDYLYNFFGNKYYGNRSGFTFEVGFYGQVTKDFSLGLHLYNPARLRMITYNDIQEYIPTVIRFGGAYRFGENCIFSLEMEKDLELPISFAAGLEYRFSDYFMLRGGVRLPDFSFSVGIGTKIKHLQIDFASSYHVDLGYSPQISLIYEIK